MLLSGEDATIRLWDVATGRETKRIHGYGRAILSVAINPRGHALAWTEDDAMIRLWDVRSASEVGTLAGHGRAVTNIAFSQDGVRLVSGSWDGSVRVWDIVRKLELHQFRGHGGGVLGVAYGAREASILSVSTDGTVRQWDVSDGNDSTLGLALSSRTTSIALLGGGLGLASAGGGGMNLHFGAMAVCTSSIGERSSDRFESIAASADGNTLVAGAEDGSVYIWMLRERCRFRLLRSKVPGSTAVAVDAGGRIAAFAAADNSVEIWSTENGNRIATLAGQSSRITAIKFSPDSALVASGSEDHRIRVWNLATPGDETVLSGHHGGVSAIAFSQDGKRLVTAAWDATVRIWDLRSGRVALKLTGHENGVSTVAFSRDGAYIASGGFDGTLRLWNASSGKQIWGLKADAFAVRALDMSSDGKTIVTGGHDLRIRYWRVHDGAELATLVAFRDGTWVVTDPEGRFDTADLESMPHLHWVMPDDPFTPVPLEVFMKDYYTPRLLARILAGEKFPPVRPLLTLNRTQPEVKLASVVPDASDPSLVSVTVTASGATKNYLQGDGSAGGKEIALATAAHDLRLFRDGQVVGYADGKLAEFKGNAFTKTFTVRLPQAKAGQEVVFSAYAFNDDRVKSETVRTTYKAPALKNATTTKGTAYVVTIGVNQHENRAWNLSFAANDARAVAGRVAGDLRKSGRYGNVVSVTLAADGPAPGSWQASKAAIRAVTARLSGAASGPLPEVLRGVAGAEALRRATPDDTLIIAFSGHGFTDEQGMFYLMPQDTGAGQGKAVTPLLRSRSISSDELSLWLRDVDAGDMTMIVDACQSAASIASDGFKPGPMGSRGLGQLSFDKGMRILAASQSDQYALEDGKLQHGLLTFSLINDGLDAFNADHEPKDKTIYLDEWLKYGVKRVPTLWEEVKTGKVVVVNRAAQPIVLNAEGDAVASNQPARQQAQTPALFDFAKRRQGIELARAGDAK